MWVDTEVSFDAAVRTGAFGDFFSRSTFLLENPGPRGTIKRHCCNGPGRIRFTSRKRTSMEGRKLLTGDALHLHDDCVALAIAGDADARSGLIRDWYGRVYALCQSKLRSQADAEDATQETFMRGLAGLEQLRSPDAIGGWLRGIANNVCIDVIRRNQVRQTCNDNVADLPSPDDDTHARDTQDDLLGIVHNLPHPLRETILLHYYEEMTYDEIAIWLGVARSTVNQRLSKARSLLKRKLLSQEVHDEV